MTIQYDKQIEVTEKQYTTAMRELSGVVAGRMENGKFFIKLWIGSYSKELKRILK